jgi:hypothetical protein
MRLIITVILTITCLTSIGQSLEAGYGESGAVLYYHGPLPLPERSVIERTDASGGTKIFKLKQAASEIEILVNGKNVPAVHNYLTKLDNNAIKHLGEVLQKAKNTTEINMYSLPSVAFGCGLALRDSTVKGGISYTYQLKINDKPTGAPKIVNYDSQNNLAKPLITGKTTGDTNIKLGWYIPENNQKDVLGFVTYRSEPLAEKYVPLITLQGFQKQTDSLIAIVRDTTTHLVGSWNYAIRLVDRFGAVGPASQPIMAHNYPPESLPRVTNFKAVGAEDKPVINLSWDLQNAFRVGSLKLYRSRFPDKDYVLVKEFAATDTTTTDYILDVMEAHFYFLEILDLGGEPDLRSVITPAISQYQPEAYPISEITAEPKEKGILISWRGHVPADRGYYILRMEGFSDSLRVISSFIPATTDTAVYSYFDKDPSLRGDRNYTYGVISESHGYQKSEVLLTASARPNIPVHVPVPQHLSLRLHDDESGFSLTWRDVAEDGYNNLFGYRVYFRNNALDDFKEFTTELILPDTNWINLPFVTIDTEWTVKTFDVFGNESVFATPVKYEDPFFYEFGPRYLRTESMENHVEIRWNNTSPGRITGFKLYKSDGTNEPELVRTFTPNELNFNVEFPAENEVHYYSIVATDKNNVLSKNSEWVVVNR